MGFVILFYDIFIALDHDRVVDCTSSRDARADGYLWSREASFCLLAASSSCFDTKSRAWVLASNGTVAP